MKTLAQANSENHLKLLASSEIFASLRSDAQKKLTLERQVVANEISSIKIEGERASETIKVAIAAARGEAVAAERAFYQAAAKLNNLCLEETAQLGRQRQMIEAREFVLRSGAAPDIQFFVSSMLDENDKLFRVPFQVRHHPAEKSPLKGRTSSGYTTNCKSIAARSVAIGEAIHKAEALALLPDQSSVPAKLEEIRQALPKVEEA